MFDEYVADDTKIADMSGKVVGITGTSIGGMGFHIAEVAIRKKAKVLLCLNRDSGSAKKGVDGLRELAKEVNSPTVIQQVNCDMQDVEGVKKAAAEVNKIAKTNGGLDVLVCNSGIMATRDKRTSDGYEVQMQTNQLSHFLLTSLIFPSLELAAAKRGEARFVTHSSSARDGPSRDLEEKFFIKSGAGTLGGDDTWMISEILLG
jgi:NAD(P)-dependent dehydrogenase (short-subunit alcohol dehydrogenase family)